MKPKTDLTDTVSSNEKSTLLIKITSLLLVFILVILWALIHVNTNKVRSSSEKYLTLATQIAKETIDDISQSAPLKTLQYQDKQNILSFIEYIQSSLGCQLYIVDQQGEPLIIPRDNDSQRDSEHAYYFNEINTLASLNEAGMASSSYQGEGGEHLLKTLALKAPNAYILGEILIPSWYATITSPVYIVITGGILLIVLVRRIIRSTLKEWRRQNLSQTIMDTLTSVPNRKGAELLLRQLLQQTSHSPHSGSILLISIDHLTSINIHYGTEAGDSVIKHTVKTIRDKINHDDFIGRWSGDIFIVFSKALCCIEAKNRSEQVLLSMQKQTFDFSGETVHVSLSIGLHEVGKTNNFPFILSQVERALFKARQQGGNRIVQSHPSL